MDMAQEPWVPNAGKSSLSIFSCKCAHKFIVSLFASELKIELPEWLVLLENGYNWQQIE